MRHSTPLHPCTILHANTKVVPPHVGNLGVPGDDALAEDPLCCRIVQVEVRRGRPDPLVAMLEAEGMLAGWDILMEAVMEEVTDVAVAARCQLEFKQLPKYVITKRSGNIFRVGIFLDFVWLTTRTVHGAYARRARRNRIDRHGWN